jgi:hypothetical protein
MLRGGAARTLHISSVHHLWREKAYCLKIASLVATSSGNGRPNIPAILARTFWSMSGKSEENIVYIVSHSSMQSRQLTLSCFRDLATNSLKSFWESSPPNILILQCVILCSSAPLHVPPIRLLFPRTSMEKRGDIPKTPEPSSWPHKAIAFPPRLHEPQHICMRGMYPVQQLV